MSQQKGQQITPIVPHHVAAATEHAPLLPPTVNIPDFSRISPCVNSICGSVWYLVNIAMQLTVLLINNCNSINTPLLACAIGTSTASFISFISLGILHPIPRQYNKCIMGCMLLLQLTTSLCTIAINIAIYSAPHDCNRTTLLLLAILAHIFIFQSIVLQYAFYRDP